MRGAAALAGALLLAGCGGRYAPVCDWPVRIGRPYSVRGVTYVPAPDPGYDVLGYAGWYGSESGKRTASGERFRPEWPTAAHPTLPLPTYLEVTSLDTGARLLVRVNDRGPFARGRVLDLSRGAAEALGMRRAGYAPVRVRRVEPPEDARDRLRRGQAVPAGAPVTGAVLANLRARLGLGEPGPDTAGLADHVEAHPAREGGVPVARLPGEPVAVVGQDRVDAVRNRSQQPSEGRCQSSANRSPHDASRSSRAAAWLANTGHSARAAERRSR